MRRHGIVIVDGGGRRVTGKRQGPRAPQEQRARVLAAPFRRRGARVLTRRRLVLYERGLRRGGAVARRLDPRSLERGRACRRVSLLSLLETRTRTRYRSVSLLPTHVPVIDPCSSTRMDAASNLFLPSISVDALLYVASRATHCEWSAEWGLGGGVRWVSDGVVKKGGHLRGFQGRG